MKKMIMSMIIGLVLTVTVSGFGDSLQTGVRELSLFLPTGVFGGKAQKDKGLTVTEVGDVEISFWLYEMIFNA